jgi:hypothetical protein
MIDVERLAQALGGVSRPMLFAGDADYDRWRAKTAAAIAEAYEGLASQDDPGGTMTWCPLPGVHEHAFRGPHKFKEWDPTPISIEERAEGPTLDVVHPWRYQGEDGHATVACCLHGPIHGGPTDG